MRWSLAFLPLAACGQLDDGTTTPPAGARVISGKLTPPDPRIFGQETFALQLAAVAIDARQDAPIQAVSAGIPVNPNGDDGQPVSFRVAVPIDQTVILILQSPIDHGSGLGRMVARVLFARSASGELTDLLPGRVPGSTAPLGDLDLGVLTIQSSGSIAGASPFASLRVLLGDGASMNPLRQNDADGDGTPDFDDPDDDNDLIPDDGDMDAGGDTIPDAQQTYDSLMRFDTNGDQVPDVFQP